MLAQRLSLGVGQWIAGGVHPNIETITDLGGLNTNLAFVVTVQTKCHPHHTVETALIAMAEPHHRDLLQIERPGDVQLCRRGRRGGHKSQFVTAHRHFLRQERLRFGHYAEDVPAQRVWRTWWPVPLAWLMGLGIAGLAGVVGSVAFVRSKAAGHTYAESDVPHAPVALVLGAQVKPDGTPSAFLAARLDLAKRLYDAGRVEMIMVSGDHRAAEYDEPRAMRDYLIRAGVPGTKVILDPGGFDTYESCVRAKQIFHLAQLVIVTQSYHLARAVATCRALGVDAIGVGDVSARQYVISWWRGAIRDQLASTKTVVDLLTRRHPMPLATQPSIQDPATALSDSDD